MRALDGAWPPKTEPLIAGPATTSGAVGLPGATVVPGFEAVSAPPQPTIARVPSERENADKLEEKGASLGLRCTCGAGLVRRRPVCGYQEAAARYSFRLENYNLKFFAGLELS